MILDSPIISGSLTQQAGQTAEIPRYTAVSSSFLVASASFDARIDSIESTTASLSPRINALESFTASANATYVNVSGDSMSGDLTITGSLIVTDRITAQEFHTEYVSSSVVFQSGSTKFGNSGDDVHSFTGSVQIDGTVLASNLEGIFSSSAQITGSLGNYYIVSGTITQTTWDNIASKPGGIVSGASQIVPLLPVGVVSGSSQLTASLDSHYIVSGTITQTTWDNIASKPGGIVSGAAQVTESLDFRYRLVGDDITFAELTFKPTLISGSSQLDGTTINNLTTTASGSFSGSFQGNGSLLTGLAAGAKFHTQSTPAATWTFIHNLSTQYPNVTVYGSNDTIILPQSITATNADTLVLEFGTPVAGYATAGIGGTIEVNGRTIKQYFPSSLSWRFEHNFGDRFANIQTYDSNYEKIIPQTIVLTDATSSLITFPEVTEGWAIGTIGGDLPAISSSYGGYVLQVSDSAPYTASWTPAADVLVTNAVNAETASYLNSFSQSLIPAVSGAYDLGSVDKPFRHIYVGTGSIYLVDNTGNIVKTLTGDSIVTNDNLSSLNTFTSSTTARLNSIETISASNIARLNSIETISASNIARLNALETTSASIDTLNTAQNTRLNSLEEKTGSLATTGSNTFYGTQIITGSLYVKENLIVQGSSSLQNITASAVDIGTNKIILNVNNPAVRYAGISVYDSGSTSGTGSLWWDSVNNYWLYEHPADSGAPYNSAILISGPKNEGNLGEELGLVSNYLVKAVGGDHISSSAIFDNGTTISLKSNTEITGSLKVNASTSYFTGSLGIGITNPSTKFVVSNAGLTGIELDPSGSSLGGSSISSYNRGASSRSDLEFAGREMQFYTGNPSLGLGLKIASTGYVGIGTTAPQYALEVNGWGFFGSGSTGTYLRIAPGGTNGHVNLYADARVGNYPDLILNTGAVERLRVSGSGDIQINSINGGTGPKKIWTGQYGGAITLLGDNTTSTRYIRMGTVDSTGAWAADGIFISSGGSVGMGITTPNAKLHVAGEGRFTDMQVTGSALSKVSIYSNYSNGNPGIQLQNSNGVQNIWLNGNNASVNADVFYAVNDRNNFARGSIRITSPSNNASTLDINVSDSTTSIYSNYYSGGNDNTLIIGTYANYTNQLVLKSNGRVGIGTTNPSYTLDVNGGVRTTGLSLATVYSGQYTTDSSWTSFQNVIPGNTLNSWETYLVELAWYYGSPTFTPYYASAAFLFKPVPTNSTGVNNSIDLQTSCHVAGNYIISVAQQNFSTSGGGLAAKLNWSTTSPSYIIVTAKRIAI